MLKMLEPNTVQRLKCKRCEYEWDYRGKNPYYACCPYCKNQAHVKNNAIVQTNPQVERPERFTPSSTKGAVDPNG